MVEAEGCSKISRGYKMNKQLTIKVGPKLYVIGIGPKSLIGTEPISDADRGRIVSLVDILKSDLNSVDNFNNLHSACLDMVRERGVRGRPSRYFLERLAGKLEPIWIYQSCGELQDPQTKEIYWRFFKVEYQKSNRFDFLRLDIIHPDPITNISMLRQERTNTGHDLVPSSLIIDSNRYSTGRHGIIYP